MSLQELIYNHLVRKNENVQREYERYVMEHIVEHYESRFKHWKILWKLNWHYRVKKSNTPLLYWDAVPKKGDVPCAQVRQQPVGNDKKEDTVKCTLVQQVRQQPVGNDKTEDTVKGTMVQQESREVLRLNIEKLIEKIQNYDIVSFDMFDTLVFRPLSDPKDVFRFVGMELCIPNFKTIRADIEKELRQQTENGEVTLNQIYTLIETRFGVEKERGMALEMYFEQALCYPNPYMQEVYAKLKEKGVKVVVTSNMYLNGGQLQAILDKCAYREIDKIFVSCDLGVSKKYGGLQKKVSEYYGNDKKIVHIGDNYFMDIEGSRIAGWAAIYYKNINAIGNRNRPEKMGTVSGSIYKGLTNAKIYSGLKLSPYYEYGYAYCGYLVYGFCKWLKELGRNKNIDKFLFVSRDMQVVYDIFKKCFSDEDAAYIKASRTSSIHLAFDRQTEHFFDWHVKRRLSSKIPIYQVLDELGFSYLNERAEEYGLQLSEILTNDNMDCFKALVYGNKEEILQQYAEEKEAALKYYKESIGTSKNICIVDLGWKGSTYNSLSYFLREEGKMDVNVISAQLGMEGHQFVDELMSEGKLYAYMFSSQDNTDLMQTHNKEGNIWRRIYEIIFTSNEQSLLKFALDENHDVTFEYLRKEIRNDRVVSELHQGIVDFADDFAEVERNLGMELTIYARDSYKPLQKILFEEKYNYQLFKDFEVCFIAGDVKEDSAEMFKDVVMKGGR